MQGTESVVTRSTGQCGPPWCGRCFRIWTPGVRPFSMEIKEWPEKKVCWPEKCSGCRNFAYDRLEVLERVRNSQAEFPGSVKTLVRAVHYPSGFR